MLGIQGGLLLTTDCPRAYLLVKRASSPPLWPLQLGGSCATRGNGVKADAGMAFAVEVANQDSYEQNF